MKASGPARRRAAASSMSAAGFRSSPWSAATSPHFEWAFGFSRRFGIVYVDFETLERVPKESFLWYRDFIAAQRAARP